MEQNYQHLYDSSLLNPYSSFSFYQNPNPNPNTNPNPNYIAPASTAGSADAGLLRPPGIEYSAHPQHHPTAPATDGYYYYGTGGGLVHQQYSLPQDSFSYPSIAMNKVGAARTYKDLETKKLKVIQGGASAASVRVCIICNVVCNSDKVFASHVAGEKHILKATGLSPMAIKPKVPAGLKALHLIKKATHPTATGFAKKTPNGLIKFVQSSYCDVCKVDCNSQEVFNSHKMGKKHMKNVQKLQASIAPKPVSTPEKDSSVVGKVKAACPQPKPLPTKEELEAKKQKVLNGGAAASAVRVCGLCNVVCNSESVFTSHIAGQKHISVLNKQQAVPK